MSYQTPSDERLRKLLTEATNIAVVGASSDPERPSYGIMQRLLHVGYRVIPVNPNEHEVQGQRAYASLADVPVPIDIVNVFRRTEHTPEVARQAVAVGAKAVWLQQGVISYEAAQIAYDAGLFFVMDLCIAVEHSALRVGLKTAG
jgi:predicted CoA-binding protein